MTKTYKIGYSPIGGIYIGKGYRADFHKHHLITLVVSFGGPFEIALKGKEPESCRAALIQKDITHNFTSENEDYKALIHLDPYSAQGLILGQEKTPVKRLGVNHFMPVIEALQEWFQGEDTSEEVVESLINNAAACVMDGEPAYRAIDERVGEALQLIRQQEGKVSINEIADAVCLSPSRFAALFKSNTGISFRKYVLHCKLIRSLQAMHHNHNLTEASFMGGFADQPHFTRTFKHAFGWRPSRSKK